MSATLTDIKNSDLLIVPSRNPNYNDNPQTDKWNLMPPQRFGLEDYQWSSNQTYYELGATKTEENIKSLPTIQTLRTPSDLIPQTIQLREFKPNVAALTKKLRIFELIYQASLEHFNALAGSTKDAVNVDKESLAEALRSSVITNSEFWKMALRDDIINSIFGKTLGVTAQAPQTKGYQLAEYVYRHLVSGQYMNSYTLPLINVPNYLQSVTSSAWSPASAFKSIFKTGGEEIQKMLTTFARMSNLSIPLSVHWDNTKFEHYPVITIEFNLFNRTFDDFARNFRFINTLVPGNMWIQNGLYQTASTLYDVEIPGRTHLFWCTGNFSVTYEGKVRAFPIPLALNITNPHRVDNPTQTIQRIDVVSSNSDGELIDAPPETLSANVGKPYTRNYDKIKPWDVPLQIFNAKTTPNNPIINPVEGDFLFNSIPDIYKVKISLTSLLPNNLNTYLMGMLKSPPPDGLDSVHEAFISTLEGFIRNLIV